jgi:legumain
MKQKAMFSKLVFYIEACESGSMFPTLSTSSKVYAVTASNAVESSYAAYCDRDYV